MRTFIASLVALLAAGELPAFNSSDWHGKRELLAREAERLRADYSNCVAKVQTPAENVTVPIETFANGSVKTIALAKKAQYFLDRGQILGFDVTVKTMNEDGTVDGQIDAESCIVDRKTRSGWAEGLATVRRGKTVFKGRGVYFSSPEEYVRVNHDSDIEINDFKFGPAKTGAIPMALPNGDSTSRVKSKTSDFDHREGVVMFEGDVVVHYSTNYTMCANQLYMFLSNSNELNRVVAIDNVSITNDTRIGTCAMATYRRRKNEIEMFGKEGVARLSDHGEHSGEIEGTRIRFWLDSEQAEVENSRISVENKERSKVL